MRYKSLVENLLFEKNRYNTGDIFEADKIPSVWLKGGHPLVETIKPAPEKVEKVSKKK